MIKLEEILTDVKKVVIKAGQAVLALYGTEIGVEYKEVEGESSPLTRADLESNNIILSELKKYGYGFLSEETLDTMDRLSYDRVWIIDPLDGTRDFIEKTGDFTVMVGLVEDGRPIMGLIYQPTTDELYYAIEGRGAFMQTSGAEPVKLQVSQKENIADMIMLGSRFHKSKLEEKFSEQCHISKYLLCGSSLKLCRIATGQGDMVFNPSDKTWEWDVCAADVIISEAGGKLTDLGGRNFAYNRKYPRNLRGYMASNGILHDRSIACLHSLERNQNPC